MKDLLCPSKLSDVDKFNGISLAMEISMAIEIQLNVSTKCDLPKQLFSSN